MSRYTIAVIHDAAQSPLRALESVSPFEYEAAEVLEDFPVQVPIDEERFCPIYGFISLDGSFVSLDSVRWAIPRIGKDLSRRLFYASLRNQLLYAAQGDRFACALIVLRI